MPTKFRLVGKECETPYGTMTEGWIGTFEDDDPRRDVLLDLCDRGRFEVVPIRMPRKRPPKRKKKEKTERSVNK